MVPIQVEVGRAGMDGDWWPKEREEGLQVMQVRHLCALGVWGTSSSQRVLPHQKKLGPPQDTLCCAPRHALFPLLRLSLLCSPT